MMTGALATITKRGGILVNPSYFLQEPSPLLVPWVPTDSCQSNCTFYCTSNSDQRRV